MSRRGFAVAILACLLAAAAAVVLVGTSDHEPSKVATLVIALAAGMSFVAAGLIAIRRRPENRTGFYLAAVGYLWFLDALTAAAHRRSARTASPVSSALGTKPRAPQPSISSP